VEDAIATGVQVAAPAPTAAAGAAGAGAGVDSFARYGPACTARHIIGCYLTKETRAQNACP
jgi:hypothetical protein